MRTQDGSTQETGRREGLRITVVYAGMGDPEVHAAGCADIARTMKTRGVSSEELDAADARAVSAHVYADQIDEGGDVDDLVAALSFKPCALAQL
ncbi:hypothetical protein [Streptomyces diastaticus]|uniref:hypothetical protein n=1 Tax=Streptomyces diastaticus TaxID=1956 RepID=UPI00365EB826